MLVILIWLKHFFVYFVFFFFNYVQLQLCLTFIWHRLTFVSLVSRDRFQVYFCLNGEIGSNLNYWEMTSKKKKTEKKGRSLCPFLLFSPSFLIWGLCLLVQFRTYSQKFRVKFGADITPSTYWNFHSHEWLRMPNIQKQPLTGCHFGKQCCSFVLFSFSFWKSWCCVKNIC